MGVWGVPVVLIAGGPGQSGVDNAVVAAGLLPDAVLDRFDLVGFDPRGVGRSQPMRCEHADTGTPMFPDLLTHAGYARAAGVMRGITEACPDSGARTPPGPVGTHLPRKRPSISSRPGLVERRETRGLDPGRARGGRLRAQRRGASGLVQYDGDGRFGHVRGFVVDLVHHAQESPIPSGRPGDDVPT
ncbi:alpha/beta fold hydrolase [Kribbella sindirgiensis]|uniref:Alpha/beta fold hydrolase n=1 Tax=Kribbella sindirgiensis TaxID=1124744 RepID=A0A4R0IEQ3_9ACTN|nr:alpha/beta fold hydrolase [Kribbella sindirgiensis]